MLLRMVSLTVLLVTVGCAPLPPPMAAELPPPTLTEAVVLPATPSPTATVVLPPTPTTVQPEAVSAGEDTSPWNTPDQRDPSLPELFVPDDRGYRLDPNWQVESVDYFYQNWGIPNPVLDVQEIARAEAGYQRGASGVERALIEQLLASFTDLYPVQDVVVDEEVSHRRITRMVELRGGDGESIQLSSTSIANPGFAPWNVFYNGRLYAQYNGSLGEALASLFPSLKDELTRTGYPGGGDGRIHFKTTDLSPELGLSFTGLLPIATDFSYSTEPDESTIAGHIPGYTALGRFARLVISESDSVRVELTGRNGEVVPCSTTESTYDELAGKEWEFSCRFDEEAVGGRFRYPIRVEFAPTGSDPVQIEGELFGHWEGVWPWLPAALEIHEALAAHETAADLLSDHALTGTDYEGVIDPELGPRVGRLTGWAYWKGETRNSLGPVCYILSTRFTIEDGKLTEWGWTRPILEEFMADAYIWDNTGRTKQLMEEAHMGVDLLPCIYPLFASGGEGE